MKNRDKNTTSFQISYSYCYFSVSSFLHTSCNFFKSPYQYEIKIPLWCSGIVICLFSKKLITPKILLVIEDAVFDVFAFQQC